MIDIAVEFAAGSAYDPVAKPGTAALAHALLKAGAGNGLQRWSEDELAAAFDDVGAIPGGTLDRDRASVQLRTLSNDVERRRAVAALAAMLQQPVFPAAALERERARLVARLREAESQPGTLADRRFYAALYEAHPYGRVATAETVAAIERDDIVRFYRQHYSADRAVVTILGDLSADAARELAAQLTGALPARGDAGELPRVALPPGAGRIDVAHPAQQAHVLVGVPALARDDPDYFPLLVGNYVLGGGGFVSRLTRDIRDEHGFAYSVYSYFLPLAQPGPFQIGLQTRRDQAEAAIARVRTVVAEFLATGPTAAELADAKASLAGGFPLRIDSNRKLLDRVGDGRVLPAAGTLARRLPGARRRRHRGRRPRGVRATRPARAVRHRGGRCGRKAVTRFASSAASGAAASSAFPMPPGCGPRRIACARRSSIGSARTLPAGAVWTFLPDRAHSASKRSRAVRPKSSWWSRRDSPGVGCARPRTSSARAHGSGWWQVMRYTFSPHPPGYSTSYSSIRPTAPRSGVEVLARLPQTLAPDAVVYVESDSAVVPGAGWRVKRSGRAGAVHHHLIAWGDHDEGSLSGHV